MTLVQNRLCHTGTDTGPVAGVMRFEEQARFHPLKFLARIAEKVEVCEQTKVLRVEDHRVETDRASERRPGADGVQEEVKGKGSVTVQPRTLHLLQSPYEHVNLAKKESAPRRRRFGMGRFRNREAEG